MWSYVCTTHEKDHERRRKNLQRTWGRKGLGLHVIEAERGTVFEERGKEGPEGSQGGKHMNNPKQTGMCENTTVSPIILYVPMK